MAIGGLVAAAIPVLPADRADTPPNTPIPAVLDRLPLAFEPAAAATRAGFVARGLGYDLAVTAAETVLTLDGTPDGRHVRLRLVGADPAAPIEGVDRTRGSSHYLIGADPAGWRRHVPQFAKLRTRAAYPGVDVLHYGNRGRLEYDLIVAPGTDPGAIRLAFDGADRVELDRNGDLVLTVAGERLIHRAPRLYQGDTAVTGRYTLGGGTVGFSVGPYDRTKPLVIDPVLDYSTYVGGSISDSGEDIVVDAAGFIYVMGLSNSADFPTVNAAQPASAGFGDAFVLKLDPSGTQLLYSTYLGGTQLEYVAGGGVDAAGHAYVAGMTHSADFPTTPGAVQPNAAGGYYDAFVTKLSPTGSSLVYSTYLGGSGADEALESGLAVDPAGHAYLTGRTLSTDFPTVNAIQSSFRGGESDGFAAKLSPDGTALVYSTYLGGSAGEEGTGIAADGSGNAYVAGSTSSPDFPTKSAVAPASIGGGDAFVTKLGAAGELVYSTYVGGTSTEWARDVAVDPAGQAVVVGLTASSDLPAVGAIQAANRGGGDAFAVRLTPDGAGLSLSTYLGGSDHDSARAVAVGADGRPSITGSTASRDFPLAQPIQALHRGPHEPYHELRHDAFVTTIAASGVTLVQSTYLGGSSGDFGNGIAVSGAGDVHVTGDTFSADFPQVRPIQPLRGLGTGFVSRIRLSAAGPVTLAGRTAYRQGGLVQNSAAGLTISAFATNATPGVAHTLVTARNDSPGCAHDPAPVNPAPRHPTANGFIGLTSGPANRPPGEWQVCFRTTDGTRATSPVTFVVL